MSFAHLNFLPFLDSRSQIPSIETIKSLSTFTPFLIPISISEEIIPKIPDNAEVYIYDDLATQPPDHTSNDQACHDSGEDHRVEKIINSLNRGSTKVITNLTPRLVELGVPNQRIINKVSSSSKTQTADLNNQSQNYHPTLIEIDPDTPTNDLESLSNSLQSFPHTTFVLDPFKRLRSTQSLKLDPSLHPHLIQLIPSSELLQTDLDQLIDLFLCRLRTDRQDGLYSTSVVSLSPSSTLLGQVYSSLESIKLSIKTQQATYFSRSRNQIWLKGETSGATQELIRIRSDCDRDCLEFQVIQKPSTGFCHTEEISCFGPLGGLKQLESTLIQRQLTSIPGSYTNRLFNDEKLLRAKIMEEAEELCQADSAEDVEGEMADLIYFALCRCISKGVNLGDVEKKLNQRSLKVTRRKGDAKPKWINQLNQEDHLTVHPPTNLKPISTSSSELSSRPPNHLNGHVPSSTSLRCQVIDLGQIPDEERHCFLKRPMADSQTMTNLVKPIIDLVKNNGDQGLLEAVRNFDKHAYGSSNDLILSSPFPDELKSIDPKTRQAIDVAYQNIYKFHAQQLDKEKSPAVVETMKGVVCSRFARPIDRVGLYVPGGTAVLPSTALMLAIPAQVAGCSQITIATPPRKDGSISPEIVYIASKCGVHQIFKAGGAHAIAALAYGTQTVTKVDKIFGPGNQFVTVAKMMVASDVQAGTAIDMPAGPSEVLVIADKTSNPTFVAADLLSQAEHGIDSQVILLSVDQPTESVAEIERQIQLQAQKLSRSAIISQSIPKSFIVRVPSVDQAFDLSNHYAPEHLILHLQNSKDCIPRIRNAGSVFIGAYSPESCGDYASGTNHSLPTVGFAKQYSGVSTMSFMKHITAQELTKEGLIALGPTVIRLANLEGLDGHANAVQVRLDSFSG